MILFAVLSKRFAKVPFLFDIRQNSDDANVEHLQHRRQSDRSPHLRCDSDEDEVPRLFFVFFSISVINKTMKMKPRLIFVFLYFFVFLLEKL